ncbi:MAG: hypothetical protein QNJ81_08605 [Acidimicrobiia bacterium]|nr:hypothetical protein [Acidimicrobiia bacterium]
MKCRKDVVVPNEAAVGVFEDEKQANRAVRWLRRSGLRARATLEDGVFVVAVPSGPDEERARDVLDAVRRSHERTEVVKPTGWERLRRGLLSFETLGIGVAILVGAILMLAVGIWLWELGRMMGFVALVVVLVAGLAYFHFSGLPHSAVKAPRRYSHKHDITMEEEQQVQYRLAWARDQWRRSRESRFSRRRRRKH